MLTCIYLLHCNERRGEERRGDSRGEDAENRNTGGYEYIYVVLCSIMYVVLPHLQLLYLLHTCM